MRGPVMGMRFHRAGGIEAIDCAVGGGRQVGGRAVHVDGVARAPAPQHVTSTRAMTSAQIEFKIGGAHKK
jgi:hypothetical protein